MAARSMATDTLQALKTLRQPGAPIVRRESVGTVCLAGLVEQSIVDGPGLRMTVFAQGCPHQCPGCHNPGTHAFGAGTVWDVDDILARFDENPLLAGVTLSGGEPMEQAEGLALLAARIRERGKTVWCYTGYTFEELLARMPRDAALERFLPLIDVLVDGRYVAARHSLSLRYRGSENQRVLHAGRSLERGQAVAWES